MNIQLMPLLDELGTAARQRREEMGLSQQQLADLACLSRATINELETGRLKNLSAQRIERLANELGFAVGLIAPRKRASGSAFESAARSASVPYAAVLPADLLLEALKEGTIPPGYIPHLRNLLQEAPVAVLADLAHEIHQTHGVPPPETWKRMHTLATVLKCERRLWLIRST